MATDPFADIKFRENYSQAYYTEIIIAKSRRTRRFCGQTPTVSQSYQKMLSGKHYKICETLALPGPNALPIQLENQLRYKKDQPYTLFDQNQLDSTFKIQNAITPQASEDEQTYWKRVSAPFSRDWLQRYIGYRLETSNNQETYYPIFIRGLFSTYNKDLSYYSDTTHGFKTGKLNTNNNRPNKYEVIELDRLYESANDVDRQTLNTFINDKSALTDKKDDYSYTNNAASQASVSSGTMNANVIVAPGKYGSFLAYKVNQGARLYGPGGEILCSMAAKSLYPYYSDKMEAPPSDQPNTLTTKYDIRETDYPAEEFTISAYIYHEKTTLYYGAWIIDIAPKDGEKTFTITIRFKRYYDKINNNPTQLGSTLVATVSADFTWPELGRFGLLTINYKYIPKYKINISTGQKVNFNNGIEESQLDVHLNLDTILTVNGANGLYPPREIINIPLDYPPNTYPSNTIVDLGVNSGTFSMLMVAEGRLSYNNIYKLYSHLIRYEKVMPDVPTDTSPGLPPNSQTNPYPLDKTTATIDILDDILLRFNQLNVLNYYNLPVVDFTKLTRIDVKHLINAEHFTQFTEIISSGTSLTQSYTYGTPVVFPEIDVEVTYNDGDTYYDPYGNIIPPTITGVTLKAKYTPIIVGFDAWSEETKYPGTTTDSYILSKPVYESTQYRVYYSFSGIFIGYEFKTLPRPLVSAPYKQRVLNVSPRDAYLRLNVLSPTAENLSGRYVEYNYTEALTFFNLSLNNTPYNIPVEINEQLLTVTEVDENNRIYPSNIKASPKDRSDFYIVINDESQLKEYDGRDSDLFGVNLYRSKTFKIYISAYKDNDLVLTSQYFVTIKTTNIIKTQSYDLSNEIFSKQVLPANYKFAFVPVLRLSCNDFMWFDGFAYKPWFRDERRTPPTLTFYLTKSYFYNGKYYGIYNYVDTAPLINPRTGDFDLAVGGFSVVYDQINYRIQPIRVNDKLGKEYIAMGVIAARGNYVDKTFSIRTVGALQPTTGTMFDAEGRYWLDSWDTTSVTFNPNNVFLDIPVDTNGNYFNSNCFSCSGTVVGNINVSINMATYNDIIYIGTTPPILDPTVSLNGTFEYEQKSTTPSPVPTNNPPTLSPDYTFKFNRQTRVQFYGSAPSYTFDLIEVNSTQTVAKYSYLLYTNNVLTVGGFTVTYTPHVSFRISPLDVYVQELDRTFTCFGVYNNIYNDNNELLEINNIIIKPNGGAGGTFGDGDWTNNNLSTLNNWYLDIAQDADGNLFNEKCFGEGCFASPRTTGYFTYLAKLYNVLPSNTKENINGIFGTGQGTLTLPLNAGSYDNNYTISEVLISEPAPDRYWKFNNSLKDQFSSLTFIKSPSTSTYVTGKVINASNVATCIEPSGYSSPFAPKYLSVQDPVLFNNNQNWTLTGWAKVPAADISLPDAIPIFYLLGYNNPIEGGALFKLTYSFITSPYNPGPEIKYYANKFNFENSLTDSIANFNGSISFNEVFEHKSQNINTSVAPNSFAFFVIKNDQGIIQASINNSEFVALNVDDNNTYDQYYDPVKINYRALLPCTAIDDLRIYNKVLTEAELDYIYNPSGTAQYEPSPGYAIQGTGVPREYNTPFITNNSPLTVQNTTKWPLVKSPYYDEAWWPANVPLDKPLFDSYNARWVGYSADASTLSNRLTAGYYKIKTTINLAPYMLDTIEIELSATADDAIYDIIINGQSTGLNNIDQENGVTATGSQYEYPRFYNIWNFTLPSGKDHLWISGINTIEFVITAAGIENDDQNPFGLYVHIDKSVAVPYPPGQVLQMLVLWNYVVTPPPPPPPTPPPSPPTPPVTQIDYTSRSSECIKLDSFTYDVLGKIDNTAFLLSSPILARIGTLSPNDLGENITPYGFTISGSKWIRNQSDPTNACGYRVDCATSEGNYPFGIMAKDTTIIRTITIPADSWITLQFRQTTPPPGYQLVSDENIISITLSVDSSTGVAYTRTITDIQSVYGKPTKRVMAPLYNAVLEYGSKEVEVKIIIESSAAIFEHYIDDIVIEYGPGYCDQPYCIDTFAGYDDNQKYLNTIKTPWSRGGPTELNFGTKYILPAGKTATQTIRLNGYLNIGAKVSVVVSGYSIGNTAGITVLLETFDENLQPLEGFSDRLFVTHSGSLLTSNDFDNGSRIDSYTSSTFVIGQACKIIRILIRTAINDFYIGFIDICSSQSVTLEKFDPLLLCKGNVNNLRVNLSINGVPRQEVNIFQAFCKYNILTNTTYRTKTALAIPPKVDGRVGTTLPTSCLDSKICNYWKQQGTADGITQTVLSRVITDNGIQKDLFSIEEGSYNNLRTIDNFIWAAPLTAGFAPDQYKLEFGETPNRFAEDNFVESIEFYFSANRAAVANANCSLYGTSYPFAKYITINADSPLIYINIPQIQFQNPEVLSFEMVSIKKLNGITIATYALTDTYCNNNTALIGGFTIEHHPEDGEFFLIKPYDWSQSPSELFGKYDTCANQFDYTYFVTMGALATLNSGAIYDNTLTIIDIKPDILSIEPAGKRYWSKKINQSSLIDLFSISSSGGTEPITLYMSAGVAGTAGTAGTDGTAYEYGPDLAGVLSWFNDPVDVGTAGYVGLCQDPADSITVMIEYTDNLGQLKSFYQDILLEDIYALDIINEEDWNKLNAYGNGMMGDFGMWMKASFVLDNAEGTGLDQCIPVEDITPQPSNPENIFPHFQNIIKGVNLGKCEPEVRIFEAIPGAADNEIQAVIIPTAIDGFFTVSLDYNGFFSAEVPFNVDADGFRASLASLSNIGTTDNVKVSGSGTTNAPFVVEFTGSLALTALPLLVIDTTTLKCVATATVVNLTVGSNSERQKITRTTDTRSPLILSYDNYVTGSIPYNASINAMHAALSLIPPLSSNIKVNGEIVDYDAAYTGPWYIDFINDLAGKALSPLRPLVIGYSQELLWSGVVGVNTKQKISITADSGSYTLTLTDNVNGVSFTATTDRIAFDATAAEISNAITTAANFLAASDISVKITAASAGYLEWTIEFIGTYSKVAVPKLIIDTTNLIKSEPAVVTRTQTGLGVSERQRLSVSRATGGYYYLKITIDGISQTTTEIPYDSTDVNLEQAIGDLSFFSNNDVIVRRDPLQPGEFKAYTISFNDKFGNVPEIEPIFTAYLICNPAILIQGPPYDYIVPICEPYPLSLTNTDNLCKPGPNDGASPLPIDCCDETKTGNNELIKIAYERELFNPKTKLNGDVVTIKQLAASRNISPDNYSVYIRDFRTNRIKLSNWNAQIISGISLVFIENQVDTESGRREIINHLSTTQELMPTRMLISQKNQAIIEDRNNLYG